MGGVRARCETWKAIRRSIEWMTRMQNLRVLQSPAEWESMLKVGRWAPKWPQKHTPARHAPGACAPAPVSAPIGPVPGPLARAAFGPRAQAASHLGRRRTRDVRALRKVPAGAPSFLFSRGPDPLPLCRQNASPKGAKRPDL